MTWNNLTPNQNWQSIGAGGFYGTFTSGGGGSVARSDLDSMRIGTGRVPHAEYPDGYLGTIRSRRDDKGRPNSDSEVLLDSVFKATGGHPRFPGVKPGTRAAQLPDAAVDVPSGFLANLGRPPRESACEILTQVADREGDTNMLFFLKDVLDKNCSR